MGQLSNTQVTFWRESFGLTVFIETGTHRGATTKQMLAHPFEQIHSIEIDQRHHSHAKQVVGDDPRLTLHLGNSPDVLERILLGIEGNILFWLDAHHPGQFLSDWNKRPIDEKSWPTYDELRVIARLRGGCRDVIVVDDYKCFLPDRVAKHANHPTGAAPMVLAPLVDELFPSHRRDEELKTKDGTLYLFPETINERPRNPR